MPVWLVAATGGTLLRTSRKHGRYDVDAYFVVEGRDDVYGNDEKGRETAV